MSQKQTRYITKTIVVSCLQFFLLSQRRCLLSLISVMSPQLRKNVITDNAIKSQREVLFIPAILLACSHYVPSLITMRLCEHCSRDLSCSMS